MFRTERSWRESTRQWRAIIHLRLVDDFLAERPDGSQALASAQHQSPAITGAALTAGLDWLAFNPDEPFERVRDAVLASLGLPVRG